MQLIESGLFDKYGFKRLHVAGHPEGNKDIDADGGTKIVDEALKFKQAFAERSDAEMAIATQFAFDAKRSSPGRSALLPPASSCRSISALPVRPSCRR